MTERFYAESLIEGKLVELSPAESHHLAHVLRKKVGDEVQLFDGRGALATAEIKTVGRKTVQLSLLGDVQQHAKQGPEITLATAVPKGVRFRWLVEKATELGVSSLVPLVTQYSVVRPSEGKLEKMRQTVIAAAKQSQALHLMEIHPPQSWDEFLASRSSGQSLFVAHPGGQSLLQAAFQRGHMNSVIISFGPEGGFTEAEIHEAEQVGGTSISLGEQILRIETAAITSAGFFRFLGNSSIEN